MAAGSSHTSNLPVPLPVLHSDNYSFWSIKMKTFFQSQDLWDAIKFGFNNTEIKEKEESKENKQQDSKALFILQQAVSDEIFPRIINATSAKNAWNILEEEFHSNKKIEIEEERLEPALDCCIYRVPKDLRKTNAKAYTPQLISIGPLHYRKPELVEMEKQKRRYQKTFGARDTISAEKFKEFRAFIEENEQRIRNCYEETFKLKRIEFVTMILYDAVFIIEFFLRFYEMLFRNRCGGGGKTDFLLNQYRTRIGLRLDLQLLENQLPFFVLDGLYTLAFPRNASEYPSFFNLSSIFFFNRVPTQHVEVKHFSDLIRYSLVQTNLELKKHGSSKALPCAVKLHESGVKFKAIKGKCLLDVRTEKRNSRMGIPYFEVLELQMTCFDLQGDTEFVIRNSMALEQCLYPDETHVCNYVNLLDFLINTEEDVDLLVERGIISTYMGDNEAVARMFNRLCQEIILSDSCYNNIFEELKTHYYNPWNRAKATLISVYFSNPWKGTATVAAVVLLILTVVQTIFSVLQVVL